jgi:hypothetical protein
MNKKVFIINGSGGCGKDTFIEYCNFKGCIINISTVDKVKEAGRILGWGGGKAEQDREFLSDLKLLADKHYNHSIKYVLSVLDECSEREDEIIVFIHCREPENIERLKNMIKYSETILIRNPNVEPIKSNMADANVENYKYDHIIYNDGTLQNLEKKARDFVSGHISNVISQLTYEIKNK